MNTNTVVLRKGPFSRTVKVMTALLFACAVSALPVSAEEASAVAEPDEATQKIIADLDRSVEPLKTKAIGLLESGNYVKALEKCADAEAILAKTEFKDNAYAAGQKEMIAGLKTKIARSYGESIVREAAVKRDSAREYLPGKVMKARGIVEEAMRMVTEGKTVAAMDESADKFIKECEDTLNSPDFFDVSVTVGSVAEKRANELASQVDPLIKQAEELCDEGKYREASRTCGQALAALDKFGYAKSKEVQSRKAEIVSIRRGLGTLWAKVIISEAQKEYNKAYGLVTKDPVKAKEYVDNAMKMMSGGRAELPEQSAHFEAFEEKCRKLVAALNYSDETALATLDPANKARAEQVSIYLRQADAYYRNTMYAKARDAAESVLSLDPYNEKAIFILNKVYHKLIATAETRRENELLERANELEWKWNEATPPNNKPSESGAETSTYEGSSRMYEKLQKIIIPEIDFQNQTIAAAVKEIGQRSKELDDGNGVNIIYRPAPGDSERDVTMNFSQMPLGEVIRYLCQYTRLKYKIADNAILIGEGFDDMASRTFKMRAALYARIGEEMGLNTDKEAKEDKKGFESAIGSAKDAFADDMKRKKMESAGSKALKEYFARLGVPFEGDATVIYDKRSSKLMVKNTPENLRRLDTILREIDIVTPLVLIESKIIEITITDLEELGFDWTLSRNNTNPAWMTGQWDTALQYGATAINQTLVRHYGGESAFSTTDATNTVDALVNNLNILPNFGPDGQYNLSLTVYAIDQSQRGEVLSTPKVITQSGSQATIKMGRDMYLPTGWDDPDSSISGNTVEYTPPVPQFGDPTTIGIEFTTTPTVAPNLYTITLDLKPSVKELVGWTDYSYKVVISRLAGSRTLDANSKMPEISVREIDTKVKVYNSETIVLGGILKDDVAKRGDKYPLLGDVPLIGRLFQSNAERSEKSNLLMFVTARLMSLDGEPVPPPVPRETGVFDFRR